MILGVPERRVELVDGTWCSTLPPDPEPGMAAVFAQLDAGTLEMWEGIDGVYRIYEPGRGHRLVVELPPCNDDEAQQAPRNTYEPAAPRGPRNRGTSMSGQSTDRPDTATPTRGW